MPRAVVPPPKIRVVGVGQAGAKAVDHMRDYGLKGVEFLSFGIDPYGSSERILVRAGAATGKRGAEPRDERAGVEAAAEVVRQAVEKQAPRIAKELGDANVVFITSGEGGLGIKGATVVADIARSIGALTIGVVSQRINSVHSAAEPIDDRDLSDFSERVNTLMMVSPEPASGMPPRDVTVMDVFQPIEQAVLTAVQGIIDLIVTPGLINLDVDDVKSILSTGGRSLVASGAASGENRAPRAAQLAIAAAHFEDTLAGAKNLLLCIQGPSDLGLFEINEAASVVAEVAHNDAAIIFGAVIDDALGGEVRVTVLASGLDESARRESRGEVRPERVRQAAAISPRDYRRVMLSLHRIWAPGIAEDWLRSPNAYLLGARPLDALRDGDVQEVIRAIEAIEAGAFS